MFYTDRDGFITQDKFDGKALAKSFSFRILDFNNNGFIGWREYNITFGYGTM